MTSPAVVSRLGLTVLVAFSAVLAGLSAPGSARADTSAPTWAVAPANGSGPDGRTAFDYQVAPGARIDDTIAVSNLSDFPVTFLVYAGDANNDTATGAYGLVSGPAANTDLGAWVGLDQTPGKTACKAPAAVGGSACTGTPAGAVPITLDAHSQALVPFTVSVPANAAPGDHAAGIVAVYRSQKPTDGQAQPVTVEQRVGSRIHLRVDGALTASLRVAGLGTGVGGDANPFAGSAVTSYTLTNGGNVRLDATIDVAVDGPFGVRLFSLPSRQLTDLLPGRAVTIRTDPVTIIPGLLTFTTLHATGSVPGGGVTATPVTQTATGWAISWGGVGLVLLVGAAIVGLVLWRRQYRRRLAATVALAAQRARDEALAVSTADRTEVRS